MSDEIFSISVYGTSELNCRSSMKNVACKVSIVNTITGTLVTKSDVNRKVISVREAQNSQYISPIVTKYIDSARLSSPIFKWNETFIYNELYSYITKPNLMFIFEIIDYTIYEGCKQFCPLAWGYLKLRNLDGKLVNADSPRNIQLYEYPQGYQLTNHSTIVKCCDLINKRVNIDCILRVCIKPVQPQQFVTITKRPKSVFEKEVGEVDIHELIKTEEEDSLSIAIEHSDIDNEPASQCILPRVLKTQLYPGDHGALYLTFNHAGTMLAAAVHKDHQYYIDLINTATFKLIDSFPAHIETIYELEFSKNDNLLLSVSADCSAKVWTVEGPHKPLIMPHSKFVYTGKFHPIDNNLIFTAGYDGIIYVWDYNQKKCFKQFIGHKTRINSMTFSPNGRRLYCGDSSGVISVWRTVIENGELKFSNKRFLVDDEIGNTPISHMEMVRSNFCLLIHTHDDVIRVFDTKAMTTTTRYIGAKCRRYLIRSTFSPDGQFIISGSEDGNILIWTVKSPKSSNTVQWTNKFNKPVTSLAWNPKRNMIAISSFGEGQPILIFVDPDESEFDLSNVEEVSMKSEESDQF
ncbi:hypothetical protein TVAG_301090 [Trichomonas vaginalis G3]|uniref:Uncharacterized protein n=1 Tax=Trichomonas vaginalis (strain ATCC PRA-98 / G3) TaxID=412133 RepID=A2E5D1_TRIV3|nr:jouberin family [Trichomonas vaginalis G3]EAY12092.1 hypothetical protein TVAG_301090 [Trichomonas vaginalis G3]KAI5542454.1 jouberin family [Trichomonas vaginalis G3]|eukprot:XP_001324315.1 hypothetical protein [Trichomonas vaginalis G3]